MAHYKCLICGEEDLFDFIYKFDLRIKNLNFIEPKKIEELEKIGIRCSNCENFGSHIDEIAKVIE
ncbi:MAG: hypothetical protein ACRDA0_06495 [Cetobacterium sp.]|uniref:hypothetical protein n=1 Tax=unclassified Cetobacterium TaxID=2630983 RepID=UPI00064586DD|nr:hypothetical protein [Cetobacterium sp. ZWU0022]